MKRISLILIIAVLICISCNKPERPALPRLVEVWGIDQSLSAEDYKLPDTAFFRKLLLERMDAGQPVTIAIHRVGHPTDGAMPVLDLPAIPYIDGFAPPSTRKKQKKQAEDVRKTNLRELDRFLKAVQQIVLETKKDDVTDVNGFLSDAYRLLQEPTFMDTVAVRRVVLVSDGLQDTGNKRSDSVQCPLQPTRGQEICLVGSKNEKTFAALRPHSFNSIDELMIYLLSNLKNKNI